MRAARGLLPQALLLSHLHVVHPPRDGGGFPVDAPLDRHRDVVEAHEPRNPERGDVVPIAVFEIQFRVSPGLEHRLHLVDHLNVRVMGDRSVGQRGAS
jgi:hypothetical protein